MIWYFLAGFIAGVVGTIQFSKWFAKRCIVIEEEVDKDDERTG